MEAHHGEKNRDSRRGLHDDIHQDDDAAGFFISVFLKQVFQLQRPISSKRFRKYAPTIGIFRPDVRRYSAQPSPRGTEKLLGSSLKQRCRRVLQKVLENRHNVTINIRFKNMPGALQRESCSVSTASSGAPRNVLRRGVSRHAQVSLNGRSTPSI